MLRKQMYIKPAILYALLVLVGAVLVLPLAWALLASLQPLDEAFRYPPSWKLTSPRWRNYVEAAGTLPLARFMLNSLLIATVSVAGAVLTSAMAGYAFACLPWRGKRVWFVILLGSMMIPGQVLLIPHFVLYETLGWLGTYKPLIVPAWLGGGAFNVLLFQQFFKRVPSELAEAAAVDGATAWQTFTRVMLPAAKPVVITAAVLSFIFHWKDFFRPLIYLSDFHTFPISLGLRMYQTATGSWVNLLMAVSLLALLPLAIVFLLCQGYLMRGLAAPLRSRH
ncbi:MAG: carbohydrate ABC transporter permease [Phycisphaerae bacterium]|nr:carbohydrate ABC transporter permease [Phycisphaerae bacterium]